LKYVVKILCPHLKKEDTFWWDCLISRVVEWLKHQTSNSQEQKYQHLVVTENLYHLVYELGQTKAAQLRVVEESVGLCF
jgi:hypothetical protein